MFTVLRSALFAVVCSLFIVFGCSGDDGTESPSGATADPAKTKTQTIGPEGGTVVSADGKLTLVIPAGALTAATPISIEPIDASRLGPEWAPVLAVTKGTSYELGPTGTTFAKPITATVKLDPPPAQSGGTVRLPPRVSLTSSGGKLELLGQQQLSLEVDKGLSLTGEMTHFSPLFTTDAETGKDSKDYVFGVTQPDESNVNEPYSVQIRVEPAAADRSLSSGGHVSQTSTPELEVSDSSVNLTAMGNGLGADLTMTCRREGNGYGMYHFLYANISGGILDAIAAPFRDTKQAVEMRVMIATRHTCKAALPAALTVLVSGTGEGSVTSNPGGISCAKAAGSCGSAFSGKVSLVAFPAEGSKFVGFGGADSSYDTGAEVTLVGSPRTVTAEFALVPRYALNVSITGTGEGRVFTLSSAAIDCTKESGPCSAQLYGQILLNVNPEPGSVFVGFSGDLTGNSQAPFISMTAAKTIIAEFMRIPQVTVTVIGDGIVDSAPRIGGCSSTGGTCAADFPAGPGSYPFAAVPTLGWKFDHWGGDVSGTVDATFFTLPAGPVSITATFVPDVTNIDGTFTGLLTKVSDVPVHDPFVYSAGAAGRSVALIAARSSGTVVTMTASSGFTPSQLPTLSGTIEANGNFTATGTGTVAGTPGVRVDATGVANGTTLVISSLICGGAGGAALGAGGTITYAFSGTR